MELDTDKEFLFRQFHGLHQQPVRRQAGKAQARFLQFSAVFIGKLIPVAVPFADPGFPVAAGNYRALLQDTGIPAQAKGAAFVNFVMLSRHIVDHPVGASFVELPGVGVFKARAVPRELDHRHLHAQADAEERQMVLPGVLHGQDHAPDSPAAETAGNDHRLQGRQDFIAGRLRNPFRIDPFNFHPHIQRVAGVAQRFRHGEVGVVQLHILAHQADPYALRLVADPLHQFLPVLQCRRGGFQSQFPAGHRGKARLLQHQRRGVQRGQGRVLDHAVVLDVAEMRDLGKDRRVRNLLVRTQHDDVRGNAHALQLLDAVLGRLGLVLPAGLQVGHQGHVDIQGVLPSLFQPHLADSLDKGLAFNIADGAADFGDHHVRVGLLADPVDEMLDLIRHMGNDLHRGPQVSSLALPLEHIGEHLARGQVGILVQVLVDEAFIMPQVQVGLRAVLGHVNLPVLVGAHGTGIRVDIGVQLLGRDLQSPRLQQAPQRRRRDALAQAGNHAAGHKNILRHTLSPFFPQSFPVCPKGISFSLTLPFIILNCEL